MYADAGAARELPFGHHGYQQTPLDGCVEIVCLSTSLRPTLNPKL